MLPFDPHTASLDDLSKWTGDAEPGSINHTAGMAELTRRQIVGQIEATEAEKRSAAASEKNARYMFWSVIVAAIAAIASAASAYFAWDSTTHSIPSFTPAAPVSVAPARNPKPTP